MGTVFIMTYAEKALNGVIASKAKQSVEMLKNLMIASSLRSS
jgi:hypothetical protein